MNHKADNAYASMPPNGKRKTHSSRFRSIITERKMQAQSIRRGSDDSLIDQSKPQQWPYGSGHDLRGKKILHGRAKGAKP